MESVTASIPSSSSSPLSIFYTKTTGRSSSARRPSLLPFASKGKDEESDPHLDSQSTDLIPFFNNNRLSLTPISKDAAMGFVLGAAAGRGWTTGSGMEGPSVTSAASDGTAAAVSTFPWSLFTKSPRRRMRVAFTCSLCGQRTTRAINPHAYTDGTVFVQCCGCNVFHKLVDNLNLFHDMKCYVSPSFLYKGDANAPFDYFDTEGDDDQNTFPIF